MRKKNHLKPTVTSALLFKYVLFLYVSRHIPSELLNPMVVGIPFSFIDSFTYTRSLLSFIINPMEDVAHRILLDLMEMKGFVDCQTVT